MTDPKTRSFALSDGKGAVTVFKDAQWSPDVLAALVDFADHMAKVAPLPEPASAERPRPNDAS